MFPSCNACNPGSLPKSKHTCWRGHSDSESGEDAPPPKRQRTVHSLTKRAGGAHDGGQQFELKVAAVLALRGLHRRDDFQVSTNVADAGNFDDLVYSTTSHRNFIQMKHTDNADTTKLVHSDLVPILHQCFDSYRDIIQGSHFKDIPIQNTKFIIYTNKKLGPKLLKHNRTGAVVDTVLKTCDRGEIFTFVEDKNKKIDVYSLVKGLVKSSKEFNNLSVSEQTTRLDEVDKFLREVILVTGQKGQRDLDRVIIKEIRKVDAIKVKRKTYFTIFRYFKIRLEYWWRTRDEDLTGDVLRRWLQQSITESRSAVVRNFYKSYRNLLMKTGIKFSDKTVSELRTTMLKEPAIHIKSNACRIVRVLLADSLPKSQYIFVTHEILVNYREELLHAWLGGVWDWLVVDCGSGVRSSSVVNLSVKIVEKMKLVDMKRVVMLTESSVSRLRDFYTVDHAFEFWQLDKESIKMTLKKKVDFQGCIVSIGSILKRHILSENLLTAKLVTNLLTEEARIKIGERLNENKDYYAPRILEKNIYLKLDVLRDQNSNTDYFAVSHFKEDELIKIVPPGEIVGTYFWSKVYGSDKWEETFDGFRSSRYIILSSTDIETCFSKLCEKFNDKVLHWLEFLSGKLMWKRSYGPTDKLWNHIDTVSTNEDEKYVINYMKTNGDSGINVKSIWKVREKAVLLVAEPGMGKSTTVTHLAWHTKSADTTAWVIRINWNDHNRKLSKVSVESCNMETTVRFLESVSLPRSLHTDVSRSLLRRAVEKSGNIVILMDGYDEISPSYADKAAVILSYLRKSAVRRIWITSRPVMRATLEKELSVTSYNMKPLSHASQEDMLLCLWRSRSNEDQQIRLERYVHHLLSKANESLKDSNFTGFPLYITMIATAFEINLQTFLETNYLTIVDKLDLLNLYDKFIERKLYIYQKEKKKEDMTNASVQDDQELLKKLFIRNHERAALVAMLPTQLLNTLHDKTIEMKIKTFLRRVKDGKDKTGVVIQIVEGRPHFVHRTFAEYFTGLWFSKNYEYNRHALENILFDNNYSVVRNVFDRIIINDNELHSAILNWDCKNVELALQNGYAVDATDNAGRTALHLLAAQGHVYNLHNITNTLLKHNASVDIHDRVLGWTPLSYAEKAGSWFVVEKLLELNADDNDLILLRQRYDDAEFIGPVLYEAAGEDYLLLLMFLQRIGVDVDQKVTDIKVTPLHVATASGRARTLRWLLEQGADCNSRDNNGWTPLFHAASTGLFDVVQAMVEEFGASLNTYDIVGRTSLDWAVNCAAGGKDSNSFRALRDTKDINEKVAEVVEYLRAKGCKETNISDNVVISYDQESV